MLEDAKGTNCQSSNFCKTVGVLAQCKFLPLSKRTTSETSLAAVNAIELIDYGVDLAEMNYARMIQMFHRFLLDHLAVEEESYSDNPPLLPPDPSFPQYTATSPPITQLLGMFSRNTSICTYCKVMREKEQVTFVIDLIYSRKVDLEPHLFLPSLMHTSRVWLVPRVTSLPSYKRQFSEK
jgi:PAB-dependent poly(A)-specific ribonuclease subunit 2